MRKEILVSSFATVLLVATLPAQAQSVRSLVNGGNDLYKEDKYTDAEVNYRKALEKEKDLVQGHFNLGNALNKEGKYGEAVKEYDLAREKATSPETRGHAWYNIGNSMMGEQKYQEAVDAYIRSLQLNPRDLEAKYNLSYALEKLKQQQQQQQNKNQDKKDQKQNQPQQQQKQMSKADAERILDVLKNSEKDVQKKLHARQAVRPKTDKDW